MASLHSALPFVFITIRSNRIMLFTKRWKIVHFRESLKLLGFRFYCIGENFVGTIILEAIWFTNGTEKDFKIIRVSLTTSDTYNIFQIGYRPNLDSSAFEHRTLLVDISQYERIKCYEGCLDNKAKIFHHVLKLNKSPLYNW